MIAGFAVALQARTGVNLSVYARLQAVHREALEAQAVRLRAETRLAADAPGDRPPLDGTPFTLTHDGRQWEVRVSDVDGLVDLYLAPPEVLALLPVDLTELVARRDSLLGPLGSTRRFLTEEQTMVQLGFPPAMRDALRPLVTQRATTGGINPDLAPRALKAGAAVLAEQDRAGGRRARISLRPLPQH